MRFQGQKGGCGTWSELQSALRFMRSFSRIWISPSKASLSTMPTCMSAILPSRSISKVAGIELKPYPFPNVAISNDDRLIHLVFLQERLDGLPAVAAQRDANSG